MMGFSPCGFKAPRFWYSSHIVNNFLRGPSWFLGVLMLARRIGAKKKVIRYPSIGIGSLAMGGAGKTTVTLKLAEIIKERGKRVGIIHSGYGGNMEGVFFTSEGIESRISDEVMLYLKRGFPTAVFKNKFKAFEMIRDISDCVLFDDFFSSLIQPSLQVIVFTRESLGNGLIQPFGPLREPLISLACVDYVLIEYNFPENIRRKLEKYLTKKIFYFRTCVSGAILWQGNRSEINFIPISQFQGAKAILVSAVAIPERFASIVRKQAVQVYEHYIFRDHCRISEAVIRDIGQKIKERRADIVITPEKDFWKIVSYGKVDFPIAGVVVDFSIEKELINKIVKCSLS